MINFSNLDKERLNLLEVMLEEIHQGVIVCDKKGTIILYNKAYGEMDRLRPEDVLDKPIEKSYNMHKKESVLRQVMESGKPILVHRQQYTTKSGHLVDTVKDTYPIIDRGEIIGACSIVRDFSNAKSWIDNIIREILVDGSQIDDDEVIDYINITFNDEKFNMNVEKIKILNKKFRNTSIFCQSGVEGKEIGKYIARRENKTTRMVIFNCSSVPKEEQSYALFGNNSAKENGILYNLGGEVLILEELDCLEYGVQVKLKEYITQSKPKIIAVYSKTQDILLKEKNMNLELLFLLNEVYISIPSFVERPSDIGTYISIISSYYAKKYNKNIKISLGAYRTMTGYSWTGNYIELLNVIRSMIDTCKGDTIDVIDLPEYIIKASGETAEVGKKEIYSTLNDILAYSEKEAIIAGMARNNNNITKTADDLGISRQNLQYRLKKIGI